MTEKEKLFKLLKEIENESLMKTLRLIVLGCINKKVDAK